MARFMGVVQGSSGAASRLGGTSSGIRAQAQGWNLGVKVYGRASSDPATPDADVFDIFVTGGSHGAFGELSIGRVYLEADGTPAFEPAQWAREEVASFAGA